MIAELLHPWAELAASVKNGYSLRVCVTNFRFELGALIGGFERCDTYSDEEYVEEHRCSVIREVAKRQAITS